MSSIVSLTQRLVGGCDVSRAYNVFLDFDCKFSNAKINVNESSSREICFDLVLTLRLSGRVDCAAKLEKLINDFRDDDPMLYILARLARTSSIVDDNSRKSSMFPFNRTSLHVGRRPRSSPSKVFFLKTTSPFISNFDATSDIGSSDFMLNAARKLLESDRQLRQPITTTERKAEPNNFNRVELRTKSTPFRNVNSTRFGFSIPEKVNQYPRSVVELLYYLFSSSSDSIQTNRGTAPRPPCMSSFESIQDDAEMVKRRYSHMLYCSSCTRRNAPYITSSVMNNSVAFSACRDIEKQAKMRAQFCGELYERISCFSLAYSRCPGRTLAAVAEFAHNLSQEYRRRVLSALGEGRKVTPSTYWETLLAAEKSIEEAIIICRVLESIERTNGSACAVLDVLNQALREHRNVRVLNDLFYSAFSPYLEMILDWVLYASSSRDSGWEFFGTVLGKKITDPETLVCSKEVVDRHPAGVFPTMFNKSTALFILRSGRSRALLESLSPTHHLLKFPSIPTLCPLSSMKLTILANWLKNSGSLFELDATGAREEYQPMQHPRIISSSPACKKAVPIHVPCQNALINVFSSPRECYQDSVVARMHNLFLVPDAQDEESSTDTEFFLEPAPTSIFNDLVVENLRIVDMGVEKEIFSFFVQEIRVFDHLKVLADFGLLRAGNFADVLVDHMNVAEKRTQANERFITRRVNAAKTFYGSSGAGGFALRKQRHLLDSLRSAFNSVGRSSDDCIELFSIGTGGWETNDSSLWNTCFEIEYDATFPLTMIVTSDALRMYSKLFNFFLSVHRARKSLRSLYLRTRRPRIMKSVRYSDERYRRLWTAIWQFSWHADHFVSIVGGYQFNQLHGVALNEFEASCKSIKSIWELSELHTTFLSDANRRVLLEERQQSVMRVITSAFDLIFQVEVEIARVQDNTGQFPEISWQRLMNKVESGTDGLRRRSTFLNDVLEKLVATGSHIELSDFLIRLNFNRYYCRDDGDVS